jgi:hypothetical protein
MTELIYNDHRIITVPEIDWGAKLRSIMASLGTNPPSSLARHSANMNSSESGATGMIFIAAANISFSWESVTNIPHPEFTFKNNYHCQMSPN